jgi:hypothetical protein
MYWRHGSRGRAPALQVQSPEFKPKSHHKKISKESNVYVKITVKTGMI